MTTAEFELQNALTTTFLANLAFLSEYDNDLYHRVDELSKMIGDGTYKEKYALEFLMENGEFDIYDIVNDKYLYDKNPKKINNELVKKIDFDEKNAIYFIEEYFILDKKLEADKSNRFLSNDKNWLALTQNDMFEYASLLNNFLREKNKRLKKIEKFIFLGTLLGRHIPLIADKINANAYLVLERNLEIFRLSLFTVDYTILAEKGVVFSIMDNPSEEEQRIQKFIRHHPFSNYMIKFSTTSINIDRYIDIINTSLFLVNNASQYSYTRYLYSLTNRITEVFKNKYRVLLMNEIENKLSFFNKLPILYIAAGPSLDDHMEWIIRNQHKFYIVTIGAAYKKLLLNDIKIDMITTLDESSILNELQFDDFNVSKIDKNTIILASIKTDQSVLNKFNKNNLFLYELAIPIIKNNISFEGFSIGEITLDILLKMNANEIYLIGLDLSLNQETGASHSKNSSSGIRQHNLNQTQNKEDFSLQGLIKVKGNMLDEVYTTSMFYNSIKTLDQLLNQKNQKVNIYNLSSHGAYFINTITVNIENLELKEFRDLDYHNKDLIDFFINHSAKKIDKESKKDLKKDLENLIEITNNEYLFYENKIIENYEEFYNEIMEFYFSIKVNNKLIIVILKKYLLILLPYLSYHFNNRKIKNERKIINKIKDEFIKQIRSILDDYIFCLKKVLK